MSGNPNQMNIQSMYSDIDLDANGIEMEFQASMEELLWFVNQHLANTGRGNLRARRSRSSLTGMSSSMKLRSSTTARTPWASSPMKPL